PGSESKEYLTGARGEFGLQEFVPIPYGNGIDPVLSGPGILFQGGFLDHALFGGHDHIMAVHILLVLKVLGTDKGLHLVLVLNIDQVLYGPSLRGSTAFWDFVDPHPETFALLGEEQHVLVVGAHEKMFQKVLVPGGGGLLAHPAPVLGLVF